MNLCMAVDTFRKYLVDNKIKNIELEITKQSTHTAQEAADANHVPVSNIVKSLLITDGNQFILVLVPGDKRLDLDDTSKITNIPNLWMSTPDEAKGITGYSIGGIPPFGHTERIKTYVVKGFAVEEELVAAGGSSKCVFRINYYRLLQLTSGEELFS